MGIFRAPGLRDVEDQVPDCCEKCEFGSRFICKNPKNWKKDAWEIEHNLPTHYHGIGPGPQVLLNFNVCNNFEKEDY